MDTGGLKPFLNSIAKISSYHFEIWETEGVRIGSNGTDTDAVLEAQLVKLNTKIQHYNGFQQIVCDSGRPISGLPLVHNEKIVATLIAYGHDGVAGSRPQPDAQDNTESIRGFLEQLAQMIEGRWQDQSESEKMAAEMSRSFEELYLYSNIHPRINRMRFTAESLQTMLGDLCDIMSIDLAFSFMPERPNYNYHICNNAFRQNTDNLDSMIHRLILNIPEDVPTLEEGYYVLNHSFDATDYRRLYPLPFRFLAVKIRDEEEDYGWIGLVSKQMGDIFRRGELRLLISVAAKIAVVFTNAELLHDLEQFVINIVKSLVFAIEAKDTYTRGHSERVNHYSMLMAKQLKLKQKELEALNWASILHDVGKIGIAESILNKPGKLNDSEFDEIRRHPGKGFEILKPINQLTSSLPGILYHHERIDGRGYPRGLSGNQIPLIARIIAVADTFDAITSTRAYRSERPPEAAIAIMEDVAGAQLDRDLVEVFKTVHHQEQQESPANDMIELRTG